MWIQHRLDFTQRHDARRKAEKLTCDGKKMYEARQVDDPSQLDLPGEEWREVAVRKTRR